MSRLVNRQPKYSLRKPSGQAKVRHRGKDTYLGRYGSPESKIAVALTTVAGLKCDRTAARAKEPIGPVADERLEALLPIVSERLADIGRLMRLTGMGPGEVLSMLSST